MGQDEAVFKVTTVKTWSELKFELNKLNSNWIFRGQSNSDWEIETSLGRLNLNGTLSGKSKRFIEKQMFHHFRKRIIEYDVRREIHEDLLNTLSLFQHYGAPTRLLDFTYSPYVAAYFAIINSSHSKLCSIYAVERRMLLAGYSSYLTKLLFEDEDKILSIYDSEKLAKYKNEPFINLSESKTFIDFIFRVEKPIPFVSYLEPSLTHHRSTPQQGCFLAVGDIDLSFHDNLSIMQKNYPYPVNKEHFVKINIPTELKDEVLMDLMRMNINEATLFPGIDGFIRSLYSKSITDSVLSEEWITGGKSKER